MTLRYGVRIEGAFELMAACKELGRDAENELRDQAFDVATTLADRIYYAARAESRQAERAAKSLKARRDRLPVITAGGTKRADAVLFGSEFGATAHFGWYARARYWDSTGRQFPPHRGSNSYWFFKTAEENAGWVELQWQEAAEDIINRFRTT